MSKQDGGLHLNDISPRFNIHTNINQDLIVITEDKMQIILNKYEKVVEDKYKLISSIVAAVGLAITLSSTEFKDFLFLTKQYVEILFLIAFAYSILEIFRSIHAVIQDRGKGTARYVLAQMRASVQVPEPPN